MNQITKLTDKAEYVTKAKWKWARHIARTKDNRWISTRSTEWQVKGVRSAGRPKLR